MAVTSNDRTGDASHKYEAGDVDVVDLLLTIWSRRRLALVTFLIVLILGGALSLKLSMKLDIPQKSHVYSSALQVGWPDSSLPTAKWLLENKYLPKALVDYVHQHPGMGKKPVINVTVPDGSSLIVLEGEGLESERGAYFFVEQQALRSLIADNESIPEDSGSRMVLREVGEQMEKPNIQKHRSVGLLLAVVVILALFCSLVSVILAGLIAQVRDRLAVSGHRLGNR